MRATAEQAAREVLDVAPLVVREIRGEMRRHRSCEVNVPQFRTLAYLDRYPGASLSEVADHIGLTLPSMSRLVDGLVDRKLVTRQSQAQDRRRITLALTSRGRASLESANEMTEAYLAEKLAALPEAECAHIVRAMQALRDIMHGESRVQAHAAES